MPKLNTPKFIGSYVNLNKPRAIEDGEPEYSLTIVLPKKAATTVAFKASLEAAFHASMREKLGKVIPFAKCKHFPIADGDEMVDDDGNPREEFAGCWVIRAKNKRKPPVINRQNDNMEEQPQSLYSGALYKACVGVYAWSHKTGGKGVSVSLESVLWIGDGAPLGGGGPSNPESDFADDLAEGDDEDLDEDDENYAKPKPKKVKAKAAPAKKSKRPADDDDDEDDDDSAF